MSTENTATAAAAAHDDGAAGSRPTPQEAWETLAEGNRRFVAGDPGHPNQNAERRSTLTSGQEPIAVIFGCSDSRLAAEIIFDVGLGDVFVIRTAGQVIDDAVLGSLEYSVDVLKIPLIVVLGHDSCGAVTATVESYISGDMPPASSARSWSASPPPCWPGAAAAWRRSTTSWPSTWTRPATASWRRARPCATPSRRAGRPSSG